MALGSEDLRTGNSTGIIDKKRSSNLSPSVPDNWDDITGAMLFVSPSGNDASPGTKEWPFATLKRAQEEARAIKCPAVIYLRAGVYVLEEPLQLNFNDSLQTYTVLGYGTANQEDVVISGGRQMTGWTQQGDVWSLNVESLNFRQLYVRGRRVERAKVKNLPGNWTRTEQGFTVDTSLELLAPTSAEFVWQGGYPWSEARCRVQNVHWKGGSTAVTMLQPDWSRANALYTYQYAGESVDGPSAPTWIENDPRFLKEPGTFVLDRSVVGGHMLHYLPRSDEDMETVEVIAPILEELLTLTNYCGVAFKGLTFADATWLEANNSFLHFHGDGYYTGQGSIERVPLHDEHQSWVSVPTSPDSISPCVALEHTSDVIFERCIFTRMGGAALCSHGCAALEISNCSFHDLSASAIKLTRSKNVLVQDTSVTRIGLEFSGSPAISLEDTANCTVQHNDIEDTQHSGISVFADRGILLHGTQMRETRIVNNFISRTMGRLADGGGLNFAGSQGESMKTGALVKVNYIINVLTPYNFGIYPDYGSEWVTIEDNAVIRVDSPAGFGGNPPLKNIVCRNNVWDTEIADVNDIPVGVTYEANQVVEDERELKETTEHIRLLAGVRTSVRDIK